MDYRKFGDTVVARFDRGEEFTSSLQELCEKENIKLASVSAIGALNAFTAGVYMVDEKRYVKNEFKGCFEISNRPCSHWCQTLIHESIMTII